MSLTLTFALAIAIAVGSDRTRPLSAGERKELELERNRLQFHGMVAYRKGEVAEARDKVEQALRLSRRLYPADQHPDGHSDLVNSLGLTAEVLNADGRTADAEGMFREALRMLRKLYPKRDHRDTATVLNNLGSVLEGRGKSAEAEPLVREAVEMNRRMSGRRDSPDVAASLNNLGRLLCARGKLADAEPVLREALGICRRLYPDEDNPTTAGTLCNLGNTLAGRGELADAEKAYREGVGMLRRAYTDRDHPDVAVGLRNLASILHDGGRPADAEKVLREALAIRRRLHGLDDHPEVALLLSAVATVRRERGELADAERYARDALDMWRRLLPDADHPEVATAVVNLAVTLVSRDQADKADPLFREAAGMNRRQTLETVARMSEGDSLTLAATLFPYRDAFLSSAVGTQRKPAEIHAEMWAERGAVYRIFEQRQLQARAAVSDPKAAKLLAELAEARSRRAELLFAPQTKDEATLKKRKQEIDGYEKVIAEKDRDLRKLFPAVERLDKLNKATPAELQKVLPADVAVVDYLRWTHFEYDLKKPGKGGEKRTVKYLAFVITKTDIRWVHLETAANIEPAVAAWREAITGDPAKKLLPASVEKATELGAKVRELVWAKVRKELPAGIKTVYVCPDCDLCRLPWAALPGDKPGTILLEDFAVATIPHAPLLLDRLWPQEERKYPPSVALAVGGVKYDAELPVPPKADALIASRRGEPLIDEKKKPNWVSLPATVGETEWFTKSAEKKKLPVESLSGEKATPAAVLAALPKAKYAHLATHGFFADKQFRSAFDLDERDYQMSRFGERVGRVANSPLVMTGLVLAGANHPKTLNRGIVTGESLIDLDLSGLQLAVLSACETGLGDDVTAGEGTFGLQRAFHYAGTRNVVASLWKVDDTATAAMMGEFYRQLWEQNQPPVEALRQAQLAVYRADATRFAELVKRGFESGDKDLSKLPVARDGKGGSHPSLWAAFTLSGDGR